MDFKDQIKSAVDISKTVGEYVRLKKSGPQRYVGLCPFHNEKTPSFGVNVAHQFYKCFGCGEGGDVFDFVMKIEGISFYEALKLLAERNGIPMPRRSLVADEDSKLREAVFQMHEIAQEQFRSLLASPAGETARAYLARRGLSPETQTLFGIGYSERSGRSLLRTFEQRHFTPQQIGESGLIRKREDGSTYDYFRNRLMFPIHNESGKIIGFGGRALAADDNPKYLNSPKTPIYEKSRVLYNLHRAKEAIRKEERVILVEGYMDAIGVTAAGFRPVVASCGTALTTQQVQALKRHAGRIVVNFDPDAAGANASERSIDVLLEEGMEVRIMELDGDLDPDEYCKERGAGAYEERLRGARPYFYWLADRARKAYDMRTPDGIVAVLRHLRPAVERIHDRLERMAIVNDLAGYIGVERGLVLDSFRKAVADRQPMAFEQPKFEIRQDERILLDALLASPELRQEILPRLREIEAVASLPSARIFQAIFAIDAAGGRLGFDEVHARLEDADRRFLAQAVLRGDTQPASEEVFAALKSLERSGDQQRRQRLRVEIREAERNGNVAEALRLAGELDRLERATRALK